MKIIISTDNKHSCPHLLAGVCRAVVEGSRKGPRLHVGRGHAHRVQELSSDELEAVETFLRALAMRCIVVSWRRGSGVRVVCVCVCVCV